MGNKQRIGWIDIAKGFATLCVIVGHTISVASPLRRIIFSFHMPLFFILAGFTFHPKPRKKLIVTSVKRLLIPYFIVVSLWFGQKLLQTAPADFPNVFSDYLWAMVFASGTTVRPFGFSAIGAIWFLMVLFTARIICNELFSLFDSHDTPLLWQGIICGAIGYIGVFIGSNLGLYLPFSFDITLFAVFLMWCGYACQSVAIDRFIAEKRVVLVSLVIWLLCCRFSNLELAARRYEGGFVAVIAAVFGTFVVCQIAYAVERARNKPILILNKYLTFCGVNGMVMYCFHSMDWWIPWSSLRLIQGFPFQRGFASLFRIIYISLLTKLSKL